MHLDPYSTARRSLLPLPVLPPVPHASHADFGFGDTVDHDVRGKAGNHKLARSRPASDSAQVRLVGQPFNGGYNRIAYPLGGVRVVCRNVGDVRGESAPCGIGPANTHYARCFRASAMMASSSATTSAWSTISPASSARMPSSMASRNAFSRAMYSRSASAITQERGRCNAPARVARSPLRSLGMRAVMVVWSFIRLRPPQMHEYAVYTCIQDGARVRPLARTPYDPSPLPSWR